MANPTYDLIEYAFYNDGTEAGSTIIGSSNNQQTLDTDTTYLCRFQLHNDNGKNAGSVVWTFEFNHQGGGWTDVSTSAAAIQAVGSDNLTEGQDCTNRLTNQGVSFEGDNNGVTEDGTTTSYSHGPGEYIEVLLAFQIPSGVVSDGDEILIRAYEANNGYTTTYTVTGDIDVNKVGGVAYQRSVSDTVGITDTISNVVGKVVSILDTVGVTDTVTNLRELYKTISDSVGITDIVTTARTLIKSISDSVGITDVLEALLPSGNPQIRAVRQAVSTAASGTQDFNVSGWSATPQLAMFIISKATADNSLATDAELAIGFTDGTDEYYCARNEMDGDVWADANRRTVHNACIGLVTDAGAVDGEFTFSQWNSGGVELTINEQFSAGFLMTVIFFAGFDNVDIQKVDKVGSPGATVTTGFQTDIVFMISNDCPADDTAYVNSVLGISMAVRGSGFGTFSSYDADASSSSVVRGGIADDYFHMQAGFSPGIYYDIGNFTSTSFDIQYVSGSGDNTDDWIVVSLDLPSYISAWCGADTSPTTATTKSNTSPGFTPQCLFGILSDHSAIDDWNGDSEAGVLALAFANQDGEDYCTGTHNDWGAETMNTGSLTDDVVVHMLDDTGSDELVATIDSWDANGWTLDYSTADGTARYALWLAIEEAQGLAAKFATILDTVGVTDTVTNVRELVRTLTDTVGSTDVLSTARNLFKTIADSVGITDILAASVGRIITLADSVGITDTLSTAIGRFKTLTENVGVTDTVTNARNLFISILDNVGITDILTNARNLFKTIAENVGITDTITNARELYKTLSDSVGITDILSTVAIKIVTLADSVGVTDVISKTIGRARTIADNVGVTDIISTAREIYKTLSDSVGITDIIARSAGRFVSILDNVGITDILSRIIKVVASISDTVGITDTITTARNIFKSISESVGITDTLSNARELFKTLSESLGVTDTVTTTRNLFKTIADSVGITDVVSRVIKVVASISDTVGITDTVNTAIGRFVTLVDTVGITDLVATARQLYKTLTDTVDITDILSRSAGRFVELADTVGITDLIGAIKGAAAKYALIQDSVNVADTFSNIRTLVRSIADSVGITDLVSTARNLAISIADSVNITDTLSRLRSVFVAISDAVGITDVVTNVRAIAISIAETVSTTDVLGTARNLIRTFTETVDITDTVNTARNIFKSISDTVSAIDTVTITKIIYALIQDAVSIVDSIRTRVTIGAIARKFRAVLNFATGWHAYLRSTEGEEYDPHPDE